MPEPSTSNLLVYRDGRRRVSGDALVRQLEAALAKLRKEPSEQAAVDALLLAGELECALCDGGSEDANLAGAITDQLANLLCAPEKSSLSELALREAQQSLATIGDLGEITGSRPEGFAYYALHPLDFADLISAADLRSSCAQVIGIRTIGTTLSAVVAAQLNACGIPASRTTVRPTGHPYDRRTEFTSAQREGIMQALSARAIFLVCDEGPGRSGSSLLSVAEALENAGVSHESIVLLCSHQPDVESLCAYNAPERWRRYRSIASGMTKRLPQDAGHYLGGGDWRELFIPNGGPWPAAWPHMERLKFLSRDQRKLYKFEGHGPYGEAVRQRDQLLAARGFGAPYLGHQSGFGTYALVGGIQPRISDISSQLLSHLAAYCAWRAEAFPATVPEDGIRQLEHMAMVNLEQEFGFAPDINLEVERPAICDSRMQPYKWRQVEDERWIKLDASTHGDDHFFPGPTDIAWDLAGISVEWRLSPACREFLLAEYQRLSGDNPTTRVKQYETAYAAFRLGWSKMAAASVRGTADEDRLQKDVGRYHEVLSSILQLSAVAH